MWRCGREFLLERAQFHQPRQPRVERCAHLLPCPSWPRSSTESRLLMRCVRANHRESPRAGDCRSLRKEHGETLGSNRCVHARSEERRVGKVWWWVRACGAGMKKERRMKQGDRVRA